MSIAVGVAAADGLVLSTDSRTIQRREGDGDHHRVASDLAEKLFLLGSVGVATYGMATIGDRSIRGLMEDFALGAGDDLELFAKSLGDHFHRALSEATPAPRGDLKASDLRWPLGFVVAGHDPEGIGRILDVKVRPAGSTVAAAGPTTRNPGVVPRGQSDAIERMLEGIDWKRLDTQVSLSEDDRERLRLLRYDLILPTTIEHATRMAEFLVQTQITMQNLHDGTYGQPRAVPGCGGAVRTIALGRTECSWVSNPGRALPTPEPVDAARGQADVARAPVSRSA